MGSRKLDMDRFRLVFNVDAESVRTTHIESIVMDGGVMETPVRRELAGLDAKDTLGEIWERSVHLVEEAEKLQ
jgi:hypothetical protein